ncbi:transcription factor, contains a PHD finger motif [Microsporum audouinii]
MTAGSEKTREKAKRTKRDNRKKHDSKRQDTGDGGYERKTTVSSSSSAIPSLELPMLMPIPVADPRPFDVLHPKPRQMNLSSTKYSEVLGQSYKFYEIADKVSNRNGFRYTYAIEDPRFPHIKYRQTDVPPYHSRFSFEDSPTSIIFTEDGRGVSTHDPWHSARANVCAREGTYYYEAKVVSGVIRDSQPGPSARGNIRLGFARREADLDVNVGVDCYGYGIRDVNGEVVNRMRCEYFFPKDESICEGDVIGMLITLPPLELHKKVVEGTYDPPAEGDEMDVDHPSPLPAPINFIRDRIPFHLKSDFMYQQSHVFASKHLRDYAFNLKETPTYGPPSPGNAEDASLRTLPGSSITIFKNGVKMGTPFENLYAFLPPASRFAQASNNLGIGERENADDGMIGYYPTVSCHNGGAVDCRFEAPWFIGPPTEDFPDVKPFGDRFNDQICEDIVADIVDEVDAFCIGWRLDMPATHAASGTNASTPAPSNLREASVASAPISMAMDGASDTPSALSHTME